MTQVKLHTNHGDITLALDAEKAPKSVANFVSYVKDGHYNGTVFHRVIKGFMIQGGGFEPGNDMKQKPTKAPIDNEANNGLKNERGAIAMARTNDPHSATAQFFINTVDNSGLDYPNPDGNGYAVFGKVVSGLDVVKKIEGVATTSRGPMQDVPAQPIVIESASIVSK